jgi:hypothetical protein
MLPCVLPYDTLLRKFLVAPTPSLNTSGGGHMSPGLLVRFRSSSLESLPRSGARYCRRLSMADKIRRLVSAAIDGGRVLRRLSFSRTN